jgi:hypothetical protein
MTQRIQELQAEYRAIHEEVLEAGRRGILKGELERHLQEWEVRVVDELRELGAQPYGDASRPSMRQEARSS